MKFMVTEMIDKLELGIIYNKQGRIINHRSLIKVILNPFLRKFGFNIATIYDIDKNKLYKPCIIKSKTKSSIKFLYENNIEYIVKKRRILI